MRTALGLSTSACASGQESGPRDHREPARTVYHCDEMRKGVLAVLSPLALLASPAHADDPPRAPAAEVRTAPPPSDHAYIEYGPALAVEAVASAGPICQRVDNCIFGSGGGLIARVGWRPSEELYIGGAYGVSKQDPSQLYRLGILQQLMAEGRRYFPNGRTVTPFALLGVGLSGYGNEWSIDTWGPSGSLGGGIEFDLGGPVLVVSAAYRPMYFHSWVVSQTNDLQGGIAHFVGIDVAVEAKDRL
jgi:hypothetical protein